MSTESIGSAQPERGRRDLSTEIVLVLALSLGASAVYSLVSIVARLTAAKPLADQQATLNGSQAPGRPWLDLTYQLLGIGFGLVPAVLAVYLMRPTGLAALGIDRRRPGFDLSFGALLALLIGVPGVGLYVAARALGLNAEVVPADLPSLWWAVPVLILAAVQNAILEEVVIVGYLITRLREMRLGVWPVIAVSATLRGSYHLYQGFGGFVGNAIMGLIFGWFFVRYRRVGPLVVAHTLLDVVAFVGYHALRGHVSWL